MLAELYCLGCWLLKAATYISVVVLAAAAAHYKQEDRSVEVAAVMVFAGGVGDAERGCARATMIGRQVGRTPKHPFPTQYFQHPLS